MNRLDAWHICLLAHEGQKDKAGAPYAFHPVEVARKVKDLGEDFEIVAFLHDVIEDTDFELQHLDLTPLQHAALEAITKHENETHRGYILRCRENFIARVVKIADIQHNLSPERLEQLPEREAKSLTRRYELSLQLLLRT